MSYRSKLDLHFLATKYNFDDEEAIDLGMAIAEVLDALLIEWERKRKSDKVSFGAAAIRLLDDIVDWRDTYRKETR